MFIYLQYVISKYAYLIVNFTHFNLLLLCKKNEKTINFDWYNNFYVGIYLAHTIVTLKSICLFFIYDIYISKSK